MSSRRHLVIMVAVGVFSSVHADVLLVDDDNCPGPGTGSVRDPYCSIQTAIDNAVDTDEIVVAPGTYFETINFLGKAITLRSSDGPDLTTIDAGGRFGAGSVVTCEGGEGPDTVLQAFTITGGYNIHGGGMLNDGTSPTINDCIFFFNIAEALDGRGGGMYNENGSPTVMNCTFKENYALGLNQGSGGGMYNKDSSPTVIGYRFMRNVAPLSLGAGGGIFNDNSNPITINCIFDANVGTDGGGMFNSNSSPIIINCSFAANNSGIFNSNSNPTITNCIVWANGSLQILDSALSVTTVSYSDVQGGWSGAGSNNIDADPLFVSISNCCSRHFTPGCDDPGCEAAVCEVDPFCCDTVWDFFCAVSASDLCSLCPNDLRLQPGSPCIDAGNNTAVPQEIITDLDGNPRFVDDPDTPDSGNPPGGGPIVDMGAYEFQVVSVCPWDLDGDGNVFVTDLLLLLMDFGSCDGSPADFDGDGCVTVIDLLTLLGNWGPCPGSGCVWDVNGDGTVDQTDLWQVLGSLGPCDTPAACPEDVNGDGVVDGQDVAAVATHFGPCP